MSVYVDNMRAPLGRMLMCHMIADTTDELVAMRESLGLSHVALESEGTHREHIDICLSKRARAVALGAIQITKRELAVKCLARLRSVAT